MQDLYKIQEKLEKDMTDRGIARYLRSLERAAQDGLEHETQHGKQLVAQSANKLAVSIKQWQDELAAGSARQHGQAYPLIGSLDPKVLAVIALRTTLSRMSTDITYTALIIEIGRRCEDEARLIAMAEEAKYGYVLKVAEGIRTRGNDHYKRYYAKRMSDKVIDWISWTDTMLAHVGGLLLEHLIDVTGLVTTEVRQTGRAPRVKTVKYVVVQPKVLEWVAKAVDAAKFMSPDYSPMVVPPVEWSAGNNGGYLTHYVRPLKLAKGISAGLAAELDEREMPVVYDSLNRIQNTPWQVNKELLAVMKEAWTLGARIDCMPPRQELELPVRPLDIETNEEARREWKNKAFAVHRQNMSLIGKRLQFSRVMQQADEYAGFERIYFPHQLDFRGRVYAVTALCPQGADNTKALLRFAEGKRLGDRGITWLAIHGANLAGVDKVNYQDRVTWVEENTDRIVACAESPFDNRWWTEVDSPWQFLAFCMEWKGVIEHGEDFVSHLPVAMDGSCSGLQHFSAMLRDPIGGSAVNLTPQEKPADVYGTVAAEVNTKIAEVLAGDDEELKVLASEWVRFGVDRKVCKRSVMTLAYGSKQFGFAQQIMEDTVQPAIDLAVCTVGFHDTELDSAPWGNPMAACNFLAKLIWEAVNEVLVKAGEAMKWLQEVAAAVAKTQLPVTWSTPCGFLVQQDYRDTKSRQVKLTLGTKVVKIRIRELEDKVDARKQASSVAPNFVHSCDAAHLQLTVVRGGEAGIESFAVIHDSFGTHAADSDLLFTTVRAAMVELYETTDVIETFREDAMQQLGEGADIPACPLKGTLDLNLINESLYCFA